MGYTLSKGEFERVFDLVVKLVGTEKVANDQATILASNVTRRINFNRLNSLEEYLTLTKRSTEEFKLLISALTIHTTHWFREKNHFSELEKYLRNYPGANDKTFNILSAGCSTGLEVYSIALLLEHLREEKVIKQYHISGFDIDPISIDEAHKAIYKNELQKIPSHYHKNTLLGSGPTDGKMTISKNIRERVDFKTHNILKTSEITTSFDVVFCRNILIYFSPKQVDTIVNQLINILEPTGRLFLGHSEPIEIKKFDLTYLGSSQYAPKKPESPEKDKPKETITKSSITSQTKKQTTWPQQEIKKKYKMLIVDDSATIRKVVSSLFENSYDIGLAENAAEATAITKSQQFDIITLDIHMPDQSGIDWLQNFRQINKDTPVVLLTDSSKSSIRETLGAIEENASDFIQKSDLRNNPDEVIIRINSILDRKVENPTQGLPILIVDDDKDVADMVANYLTHIGIANEVVTQPHEALKLIKKNVYFCILSDYKMPELDGLQLAEKIVEIRPNMPIVIMTGFAADFRKTAHRNQNIINFLEKPFEIEDFYDVLEKIAAERKLKVLDVQSIARKNPSPDVFLIGVSTGGPKVLSQVMQQLPPDSPPIVLVQHIPHDYVESFSKRLATLSGLDCVLVQNDIALESGKFYMAGGDFHLRLYENDKGIVHVKPDDQALIHNHRPAVDPLFQSAAKNLKKSRSWALLLTGMGTDGAQGLKQLKDKNCITICQDRASSIVYGMPKAGVELGAATYIFGADEIHTLLQSKWIGCKAS